MAELKLFALTWLPFINVKEEENKTEISGPIADLMRHFTKSLNYSYVVNSKKESWGDCNKFHENSSFDDLRKCLLDKKVVDVCLYPIIMNYADLQFGKHTHPIVVTDIRILAARPYPDPASIFQFLMIIHWKVFRAILFSFVLLLVCITFLDAATRNFQRPNFVHLCKYIWHLCATFLSKDSYWKPPSTSLRILTLFFAFGAFFFFNVYSGDMTSSFFLTATPPYIKNVKDFLLFPKVIPLIWGGSAETEFLKDHAVSPYKELWKRIEASNSFIGYSNVYPTPIKMADMVQSAKYAYIALNENMKFILRHKDVIFDCEHRNYHIGDPFIPAFISLMVPRDTSQNFMEELNRKIVRMQQAALLDDEFTQARRDYTRCVDKIITPSAEVLTTRDVSGLFVVWFGGLALATVLLVIEKWTSSKSLS